MTALAPTVYGTVIANHQGDGASTSDALPDGLGAASWVMTVLSALGIVLAVVATRHHRAVQRTLEDAAASAAAHLHRMPTSATLTHAGSTTQEGT
jgi:hypothetical protein